MTKILDPGQPDGQDDDRGPRKRPEGKQGGEAEVAASPPENVAPATKGPKRIIGGFGEEPNLASMGYDPQERPKHGNK